MVGAGYGSNVGKHWRNAATLILAAKKVAVSGSGLDYNLLMLQRSSKSKFMPNTYVFPGGVADPSDFDPLWRNKFRFGSPEWSHRSRSLPKVPEAARPMLMLKGPDLPSSDASPPDLEVGFRIAAIRETFEECGILLSDPVRKLSLEALSDWRGRVQKDPAELLRMFCDIEGLRPDVWGLYEWSDWLTPCHMISGRQTRRFDTIFYIAFVEQTEGYQTLKATADDGEVTGVHWADPKEILQSHVDKEILLAPPQVYEIARLANFETLEALKNHVRGREARGCETWLPVLEDCADGSLALYPGDGLYPSTGDIDWTCEASQQGRKLHENLSLNDPFFKCDRMNRMVTHQDSGIQELFVNLEDHHGHINPCKLPTPTLAKS